MEYENGENFTAEENDYISSAQTYIIFHDIIFVLIAIVAICANVAIIYTIGRSKRLRTPENMFLLNWVIADLGSLIVTPSAYEVIYTFEYISASSCTRCIAFHIASTLQATTVMFVILLVLDWFLATFFEKASENFRKYYKYIIGGMWIISVLLAGFTSGYCLASTGSIVPAATVFFGFCGLLLFVVVLQITRFVKKCLNKPIDSSTLMLTLVSSFVGCWLLAFLLFMVINHARLDSFVTIVAEAAVFGSSIVNLGLLYKLNTDFQEDFLQVLNRAPYQKKNTVCSFENPIVRNMNNINNSIQISFDNPKDELLSNEY